VVGELYAICAAGYRYYGSYPIVSFQEASTVPFAEALQLLDGYSVGLERMVRLVQTAQF
jgi:hypothetical protein